MGEADHHHFIRIDNTFLRLCDSLGNTDGLISHENRSENTGPRDKHVLGIHSNSSWNGAYVPEDLRTAVATVNRKNRSCC